jgi:hypothetical protein
VLATNQAFKYLGGVPQSIVYDNTKIAVAKILGDKDAASLRYGRISFQTDSRGRFVTSKELGSPGGRRYSPSELSTKYPPIFGNFR